MSEFLKRELVINTQQSRLFITSKYLDNFAGNAVFPYVSRKFFWFYDGPGIFKPQACFVVGLGQGTTSSGAPRYGYPYFTWNISSDNGKLYLPDYFCENNHNLTINYDNFDHVPPIGHNDGYTINVTSIEGANRAYWFTISGTIYYE